MTRLIVFGLGYSARHYLAAYHTRWTDIAATTRAPEPNGARSPDRIAGRAIDILAFDGSAVDDTLRMAATEATAALVSIPPVDGRDRVLECLSDVLSGSRALQSVVYLSTVGVYGDHDGAWVDESTPLAPTSERSRARAAAEAEWQQFARRTGHPVAVLRLAGIYGPGRNTFDSLVAGTAKRIVKPGQIFNRIHVDDIAQTIDACFAHAANGIFNVCDDEPAPPQDVVAYAANLMGIAPPPEQPFAAACARLSPMALSFYGENKRVRNARIKQELGVRLRYPSYREGLAALWQARKSTP